MLGATGGRQRSVLFRVHETVADERKQCELLATAMVAYLTSASLSTSSPSRLASYPFRRRSWTDDSMNQKIVQLLAHPKLRSQPAGLFPAAGPKLSRIFRILVLGKDLRVRAALVVQADNIACRFNPT
jgi:hypothetical protein